MASSPPRLPLDLGLLVQRRTLRSDAVGIVVGFILRPTLLALVRWDGGRGLTFEAVDNLVQAP